MFKRACMSASWAGLVSAQRRHAAARGRRAGAQIGTLLAGTGAKNLPNLNNLAMQLRKVCCHPVRAPARAPSSICMDQVRPRTSRAHRGRAVLAHNHGSHWPDSHRRMVGVHNLL
jgi:hypothetical protein